MKIKKVVRLSEATRNELIEELKKRVSITSILVSPQHGASIISSSGNVSVDGEAFIFVIKPNK